ncbi:DUF4355 domain-containing protein [Apilactobacillus nanyangensis]|uniref:DUF4355 domain-containing protein n=1 Tax=Apilactobacillus nanyangensis TaxID=2799579 RepID=UPI0019445534|nr:DUF4355 domain-containing protein [Apilactobacillus nanyangensis]
MADEPNNSVEETEQQTPEQTKEGGKTYTQEDVNRMMSSKAKETESKLQANFQAQIEELTNKFAAQKNDLIKKGEERAKMDADQRAKAELADREEEINRQKAEIEKTVNELKSKQALSDTKEALVDAGLPKEFAGYLSDVDSTKRADNIKEFSAAFTKAVDEAVDKRVSGTKTPDAGGSQSEASSSIKVPKTKQEFFSMPQPDQLAVLKDHPDLASKLGF